MERRKGEGLSKVNSVDSDLTGIETYAAAIYSHLGQKAFKEMKKEGRSGKGGRGRRGQVEGRR